MQFKKGTEKMKSLLSCCRRQESIPDVYRRKLVIVGDGECGKTSLVTRMADGSFTDVGYVPTVFETQLVNVSTGQEEVELVIYDTAGQEDYDRLRPLSYADVDVALICFNLADPDSLANVADNWGPEINYFCGKVPIILVGNKKDLRDTPDAETAGFVPTKSSISSLDSILSVNDYDTTDSNYNRANSVTSSVGSPATEVVNASTRDIGTQVSTTSSRHQSRPRRSSVPTSSNNTSSKIHTSSNPAFQNDLSKSVYASSKPVFRRQAPVKHSEGAMMARRVGALAYFETSALTGDNVEEVLLAVTKAAVLGSKKAKKFKPLAQTLETWRSVSSLAG